MTRMSLIAGLLLFGLAGTPGLAQAQTFLNKNAQAWLHDLEKGNASARRGAAFALGKLAAGPALTALEKSLAKRQGRLGSRSLGVRPGRNRQVDQERPAGAGVDDRPGQGCQPCGAPQCRVRLGLPGARCTAGVAAAGSRPEGRQPAGPAKRGLGSGQDRRPRAFPVSKRPCTIRMPW